MTICSQCASQTNRPTIFENEVICQKCYSKLVGRSDEFANSLIGEMVKISDDEKSDLNDFQFEGVVIQVDPVKSRVDNIRILVTEGHFQGVYIRTNIENIF